MTHVEVKATGAPSLVGVQTSSPTAVVICVFISSSNIASSTRPPDTAYVPSRFFFNIERNSAWRHFQLYFSLPLPHTRRFSLLFFHLFLLLTYTQTETRIHIYCMPAGIYMSRDVGNVLTSNLLVPFSNDTQDDVSSRPALRQKRQKLT